MITKNYTLSAEQKAEVEKAIAEGNKKYASIAHIIWESAFDAGPFFEHELECACSSVERASRS